MTPCVETTWPRSVKGYGQSRVDGVHWRAHRYAWTQVHGPIPAGMGVLHRCDNPPCINVDHLFLGTNADNTRDRHEKGRDASGDGNGARLYPETRRRARNGHATLTEADVEVIRNRRGESSYVIARDYGVNPSTIQRIWLGRLWRTA